MKLHLKLALLLGGVTLGVGVLSSALAGRIMYRSLEKTIIEKGQALAAVSAEWLIPRVIDRETLAADGALREIAKMTPNVTYAFLVGFDGKILASTFDGGFPRGLAADNVKHTPAAGVPRYYRTPEGIEILQVSQALITGMPARIAIGMDLAPVHAQIVTIRNRILGGTMAIVILGVLASLVLSLRLTQPLKDLMGAMTSYGLGKKDAVFAPRGGGGAETDALADAFNRMIADRQRAKEALQENQANLLALIENTKDDIWSVDTGYRLITGNSVFHGYVERYLGRRLVPGESVLTEKIPEESLREWRRHYDRALQGERFRVEKTLLFSIEPRLFDYSFNPIVNIGGKISGVVVFGRDITENKKIDAALRNSEEYVRTILHTVDEGFITVDGDLRIISANRAFLKHVGLSEAEVLGKKCHEITHHAGKPCFEAGEECPVRKVLVTGTAQQCTHTHVNLEGRESLVDLKAYPLRDASGKIVSVVETFTDVTEKKMLEGELLKAQKLESIGLLAGGLAHDFNNLLMGIFGYISLAKLDAQGAAAQYLEEAEKALDRAKSLTMQLLTFSKGGKPVRKPLDLSSLLRNAISFSLSGTNFLPEVRIDANLKPVEIDEGQIHQVVQNMILNAMEAMPDGGRLEIEAANVDPGAGKIPPLAAGPYVRVTIRDAGPGIPREHLKLIFDPYFTTKPKGKGLGLAAAYSIIKNHDGYIEVESAPGRGSTFRIYLPALVQPLVPQTPALSASTTPGSPYPRQGKILVMDDEELIRNVSSEILKTYGYEVVLAANGEEAIANYLAAQKADKPFDAVILDLTIKGGMGGRQTIAELRKHDPGVRAIVASGYTEDAVMANFRAHGFDAALPKPFRSDQLRAALRTILE